MKKNKKIIFAISITLCLILISSVSALYINEKNDFNAGLSKPQVVNSLPKEPKNEKKVDPEIFNLSLSKIFDVHPDLSKLEPNKTVTIIVTGDIIPARYVNYKVTHLNNFQHPYLKTAEFLRNADLTLVNLEAPLVPKCPVVEEGMTFCGDQRNVGGLVYAGIDIASLANNHSGNYGTKGISETQSLLITNGITPVGYGLIGYKKVKGVKFAILAYNGVGPKFDLSKIGADIKEAKKNSDVVIVMPHWGKEYVHKPESSPGVAPDDPKVVSHAMIDAGADLIVGNHPHWYQGVEIYKNKLITYAHGNFIFDQMWSLETTQGVVGKYTFYNGKLVDATFTPIQIADYNQPFFLDKNAADKVLGIMKANSW